MNFIDSFRMERIYFEKLKNNITDIKNLLSAGNTEDARILLENSVDVDGAVLLLYRNLGECWAELADQIKKTREELDALKEATEAYHDELNEKIDNINFVLVRLINALDARLTIVENDLATMPRVKFLTLVYDETESEYSIQDAAGNVLTYNDISELAEFPHYVVLTDADGNYYIPKSFDEIVIVWHIDEYNTTFDVYSDISVVIDSDDVVTLSESTLPKLSAGNGIVINSDNEIEVDTTVIQEKLTEGTGIDIDSNNEISVDTTVIQEKLTEGTGIDIDSNNEISVDTTVIQEKLTEGFGIDIDSNNEIKVDTTDIQEKLIAGQNITLTPDSTDPTKTVIDASGGSSYTQGKNIVISNNTIDNAYNFQVISIPQATLSSGNPTVDDTTAANPNIRHFHKTTSVNAGSYKKLEIRVNSTESYSNLVTQFVNNNIPSGLFALNLQIGGTFNSQGTGNYAFKKSYRTLYKWDSTAQKFYSMTSRSYDIDEIFTLQCYNPTFKSIIFNLSLTSLDGTDISAVSASSIEALGNHYVYAE